VSEAARAAGFSDRSMTDYRADWRTPPSVVDVVREALGGRIVLDPCASLACPEEEWIGEINITEEGDGLDVMWWGRVFVNPPYSDNAAWIAKCSAEAQKGREIIALIPARVDTRYWHEHASTAQAVCFWKGRLRFVGAESSAPFPVAFIYWGPNAERFAGVFAKHGLVYTRAVFGEGAR
jgi:hypothetical protein